MLLHHTWRNSRCYSWRSASCREPSCDSHSQQHPKRHSCVPECLRCIPVPEIARGSSLDAAVSILRLVEVCLGLERHPRRAQRIRKGRRPESQVLVSVIEAPVCARGCDLHHQGAIEILARVLTVGSARPGGGVFEREPVHHGVRNL